MPVAMPQAMLNRCSEQSTQRNATDERDVRHQDTPKSSSVPDPRTPVDNPKSAYRVMVADDVFTTFVESLQGYRRDSARWRRFASEAPDRRRYVDAQLARERAYDAETDRLRAQLHAERQQNGEPA